MSLQHFVPRFVLSQFATSNDGRRKKKGVTALDLARGTTFQASLMRVAAANGFYDFTGSDGQSLSIDPFLTDI